MWIFVCVDSDRSDGVDLGGSDGVDILCVDLRGSDGVDNVFVCGFGWIVPAFRRCGYFLCVDFGQIVC